MTETATPTEAPQEPDALAAYKARVRAKALELKRRFDWCRDETNEHLEALDLEPLPTPQTFTFLVPTTGVLEYVITAYSETDAHAQAVQAATEDAARFAANRHGYRRPNGKVVSVKADTAKLKLHTAESAPDAEVEDDEDDD